MLFSMSDQAYMLNTNHDVALNQFIKMIGGKMEKWKNGKMQPLPF
jgi:hypothetical protein